MPIESPTWDETEAVETEAEPTWEGSTPEEAPRIVPPGTKLKLTPYQQAAAEGRDTGMWGEGPMAIARGQPGGGGEAIGATAAAVIPAAQAAGKMIGEGWEATSIPQVGRDLMSDFLVRTGIDPSSTPNPELGRVLNLPRLTPDMVSGLPQPLQIGAGVANVVPTFIEGIAQDPALFVATFGSGTVPKVARTLLGTQQLLELPQEIREAVKVWGDPKSSTAEKTQAILQPGVSAIFAREMVRHGWRPAKPESITGEDLKGRPEGAPLPPQPPPVPTEPVPPRTAFPPGPAPTGPVPPREAFPPGPAPTAPVPPREAFPPGPAPAYPPDQQWAYRSDLPPGPAPRTPVPPRPPDVVPGTQPAVSAEVPAVTDFREASKIPGLEFQDWLDKHGRDLTRPTNAAYAMADAIKTPEDLATVETAGADARKEVAAFREKARAAMAQNPEEGVKLLNKAAAFVSKIQYFDEAARMYKARQAVAGGISTADAAKEFGVTEKHIGQPSKPSETQPTTPTPEAATPTTPNEPAPAPSAPVSEAPTAIEKTPLAGKTIGEWEAVKDASQLPKGEARAALAKWLAVPNQPTRILQALANKKRTREIHAPPTEVAPVEPAAPPKAPAPTAPEGMLLDVPEVPRTGPAARAYLIRRLEELEDVDPITGQAMHTRPAKGFGPLADPEGFISNQVSTPNGDVRVASQGGRLTVEIARKDSRGESRWVAVENFARGEQTANAIGEGVARATESPIQPGTTKAIMAGLKDLERQRQALIKEGEARKSQLGPTGGAGPGSPSITQGPDPQTIGLSAGSPTLNRLQRAFSNFYAGMGQLFKRGPVKQDLMTLANRATNLPKIVGQKAGNSIRLEAATRTAQQQEALTFLIQSLKMSGEGLSEEGAARLGKLEFEGDPTGYLRTKQADMETLAQQFLQQGKKLEAEAAIKAAKAMQYAREHFNELRPVADLFRRKTDLQHARLANGGIDVQYENWYVPQRQDLDLMTGADRPIVLGHSLGAGVATGFKKAKVYEDYASAIEAGFIPRSLNAADLLENYVAQTERVLMRKGFFDAMREIPDPVDGKSVVIDVPRRVITRPDGSIDVQESVPIGYTMSEVVPGARVAVHNGYNRLVKALTGSSQLAESAPVGTLQDIAAIEKHIGLALDTFHLSRVLQAELALTGKISVGDRLRMGRALVEYSPRDLDKAVTAGELTQEMADWIRTPQEIQVNGRAVRLNPQQVLNIGINNGLNIARFADVIYRDWLRETPILKETTGALNKLVFDKISRSAIAHGFSAEFERIAAQRPELSANQVGKQVARDINVMFGNLQKESFFRNPSLNSIMQILFLAPRWVESLARREARGAIQLGTAGVRLAQGKPANLGTVGKGIGTGLAAYFVGTQILNLITRHQLTFQNKERGHKLDAWIPDITGKTSGFFISPLSVFGEITHDILRYAESKPDTASALTQIVANKLGNFGRFLEVVASGRDPMTGDKIIGSGRRAIKAGLQLIPVPITLSQGVRAAGHAVAPELIQAPPPGAVQRQVTASAGFKTEPAGSAQSQVYRMADDWKSHGTPKMQAELERRLKEDFGPSDYGPLRTALVRDDPDEARRAYQQLRQQGKTPKTIRQTMQHPHPFTGSAAAETKFKASLSPEDKETYRKAIEERKELYRRFQRMLNPPQQ